MRRVLLVLSLSLVALLCLALLASQIDQHISRRRAERLLAEIQSLQLSATPWYEALSRLQHWGTNEKHNEECNEQQCSLEITLAEPVYNFLWKNLLFVHLDDYLRWRLKLSYETGPFVRTEAGLLRVYLLAGGRPARVVATVGMRDGIVQSKGFQTAIESHWHVDEFIALISNVESIPQFSPSTPAYGDPQLTRHPTYVIERQAGCCDDFGYVRFTPEADPDDVHRLMQFNLACLTQIRPCVSQSDLIPAAWAQYLAEHPEEQEREGP